ncbi:MAG: penicillin-binding protein activator [Alphaproteobacteria bacterium]|nr:penicillin-binding protein activator [Alphaproteobacteria bacterium]
MGPEKRPQAQAPPAAQPTQPGAATPQPPALATPVAPTPSGPPHVGLLLPLSGPTATLGNAMLAAAEMALFDQPDSGIVLLPRDTQGVPDGAVAAAHDAIQQGAQIIIGPLLAAEVEAVKPIAAAANVPVLAFSNSTAVAGGGVFLLGFQPQQEITRIVQYALAKGHQRFGVLAPDSPYGNLAIDTLKSVVAAASGAGVVRVATYDPATTDLAPIVQSFAQGADFDALLLPEGGTRLRLLAPLLPYDNIDPDTVKFLGTGLWDVPGLGTEPALAGGWYAAPAPAARAAFESRYKTIYGQTPPRLATLPYDAVSLVVTLVHSGGDLSSAALTNANGFAGVDGIFRLLPSGITQRGLAVLQVERGQPTVVDPAPTDFRSLGE